MNLDHGVLHHVCSCLVSGLHQLDWYEASALVNKWSAPLGWLNDRLLQFVELPFLGGFVEFIYVALGVIEVLLGAALIVLLVLGSGIVAQVVGAFTPALAELTASASRLSQSGWRELVLGVVVGDLVLAAAALFVAYRSLRGKTFALAACGIGLVLVVEPMFRFAQALRGLGVI